MSSLGRNKRNITIHITIIDYTNMVDITTDEEDGSNGSASLSGTRDSSNTTGLK
jgi:hypothetical protein